MTSTTNANVSDISVGEGERVVIESKPFFLETIYDQMILYSLFHKTFLKSS